jgi:tryptophanyl-tRNA synthetase
MLTYPVHQAADILFCKGNVVPVGKDQLPHIEVTRQLARRFNERFCGVNYSVLDKDGQPQGIANAVFTEPSALLSNIPHLPGLDGRKMSKSFGNAISLRMTADETAALIKKSETDSTREIFYDPEGRPGVSALLTYIALLRGLEVGGKGEQAVAEEINASPNYGSGLLKQQATEVINDFLAPHRARRLEIAGDVEYIRGVLRTGIARAREIASQTLSEVQQAMGTVY